LEERATTIAIIGGGVIGCAVGLELARRGERPVVIDHHGEVGHGSTSASCGIVRRFYPTLTMCALAEEGARTWADWPGYLGLPSGEEAGGLARFERPGVLFIPPAMDESITRILGHMGSLGLHAEVLSADEVGHAVMAIRDGPSGSRFRLEFDDGGVLDARVVLNAGGPHSGLVNRLAGVTLPIETRPLRREVCLVTNPRFSPTSGSPVPVVGDLDSGIYFRPEAGGRELVVGSLEPECDAHEWVDDPDTLDDRCSEDGWRRQVLRLMKRFPEVGLGRRRGLAGLYDVTVQDWNPVVDRTDRPGYYVAMGTSGSSFKTAPALGAVVAQLILACEAGLDHDHQPLNIILPRTGFELDVGFFSRLRGAHVSSGTVLG
jgi:sarcosine oxidase subunit beta